MKMETLQVFPKWNLAITTPQRIRIILRSFRAALFLQCTEKWSPPQTPKAEFPQIFYRARSMNAAIFCSMTASLQDLSTREPHRVWLEPLGEPFGNPKANEKTSSVNEMRFCSSKRWCKGGMVQGWESECAVKYQTMEDLHLFPICFVTSGN